MLFSLAPLCILPRIIPLRGRCGSPFLPYPAPYLVLPIGPVPLVSLSGALGLSRRCFLLPGVFGLLTTLSTLNRFGSFSPPFSPQLPLFPTDQLPLPTSTTSYRPSASRGSTWSTFGSVTRVTLLLRTYLAGLLQLQVYMLEGTSSSHVCFSTFLLAYRPDS